MVDNLIICLVLFNLCLFAILFFSFLQLSNAHQGRAEEPVGHKVSFVELLHYGIGLMIRAFYLGKCLVFLWIKGFPLGRNLCDPVFFEDLEKSLEDQFNPCEKWLSVAP